MVCNYLKILDSDFRRNDEKWCFLTFYDFVKFDKVFSKYGVAYIPGTITKQLIIK